MGYFVNTISFMIDKYYWNVRVLKKALPARRVMGKRVILLHFIAILIRVLSDCLEYEWKVCIFICLACQYRHG